MSDLRNTLRAAEKAALNLENAMIQADLIRVELGQELRQRREQKRIALREVARQLSVSATYVSDMERGNRNPFCDPDRLRHWIAILGEDAA